MAVYNTSTVTVTVGSQTVKGTSYTDFTTYVTANDLFQLTDTEVFYTVAAVSTASRLTLSSRYADTSNQTSRSENIASTNNATKCYSGTLSYYPVIQNDVVINASNVRYTDNGGGVLTGTPVTGTPVGTIDYDTGSWTLITATTYSASVNVTASYFSGDELTSQSYQIVRDFTPNYSMPEMSLNDTNFPNIYTNALRTIDRELQELEDSIVGSVLNMTVTNNASVFQTLTASELVVKHTASILTLENGTGHITTFTSNSITATSLIASGLDIVSHVNNAASDPHNVVNDTAYASTWNGSVNTAPSRNAVYDKINAMISNTAYNSGWDGTTTIAPSKNAVYDKIQLVVASIANSINDTVYGASWDGVTKKAPSKNAVYDKIELVVASLATHENAADPHTIYLLADGTRAGASSQTQNFGTNGIAANQVNATTITVTSLIDSANGEITTLTSNSITATELESPSGHITTLTTNDITATSGTISTLDSTDSTITTLESTTGHISTLTSNSITATTINISSALTINNAYTFNTADGNASECITTDGNGNLSWEPKGAVAGEANTATNLGTSVGTLYKTKSAAELQFRRIAPNSSKVAVSVTATDVKLDVTEAQLSISNMNQTGHVTTLTSNSITATNLVAGGLTYPTSDASASYVLTTNGAGTLSWEPKVVGSGETNTATNVGTAGVGIYDNKNGVEFHLRKVNAGSSKVTVSNTASTVAVDVAEAQLSISNMNQTGHMTTFTSNSVTATAIVLRTGLADGEYCGVKENGVAGAALIFGDSVYLSVTDGRWEKTDSDDVTKCRGKIGICIQAAAADASPISVLLYGNVRADAAFPVLTKGAPMHLGSTAGDIVTATSGTVVRVIGYGNNASELFVDPDGTFIERA